MNGVQTRHTLSRDEVIGITVEMDDGRLLEARVLTIETVVYNGETRVTVTGEIGPVTGTGVATHMTFLGQSTRNPIHPLATVVSGTLTVTQDMTFGFDRPLTYEDRAMRGIGPGYYELAEDVSSEPVPVR